MTQPIEPSAHSIGWPFSYLDVVAIVVSCIVVLLIRAAVGLKSRPEGVSLSVRRFGRRSNFLQRPYATVLAYRRNSW